MKKITTSKKYIQIILLVIITAIVVGVGMYLLMKRKQTISQGGLSIISSDDIAIGKPCDARNLKSYNGSGEITNTKGLQCYMYDDPSNRATRRGVWIYPNRMSIPAFLAQNNPSLFDTISLDGLTQNWKLYNNPVGNYSFKFPSQWKVKNNIDPTNPNEITIHEPAGANSTDYGLPLLTITYHPGTKFENTNDFQNIKDVPDDLLMPDSSTDTFIYIRHFDLNGTPVLLVERMNNFDIGSSPYSANPYDVTIYITKSNSYFTIEYSRYQNLDIDLPVEILIKTLQFK